MRQINKQRRNEMSLENTLREMLSEGSEIKPSSNQTPKSKQKALIKSTLHAEGKPNPTPAASGPGVDYNPTRKGLKEFYKARLEGALLGESKAHRAAERSAGVPLLGSRPQSHRDAERAAGVPLARGEAHEMPARWGANREALGDALSGFAKGAAVGGLASVLGIAASDKVFPHQDVATHNARVAAGEVLQPKGVSIGQVRATAEPLPEYGAFQRAAIAARAKGKKGK
jgi:hypothetical protein